MRKNRYNDIDLLILYDPKFCAPDRAHRKHQSFTSLVAVKIGAPVHLCLLTYNEESEANFIALVSARLMIGRSF